MNRKYSIRLRRLNNYNIHDKKTAGYDTDVHSTCFACDETDHMVVPAPFRAEKGNMFSDASGLTELCY